MAHRSEKETTLLPILEAKQRDIERYKKLGYRRIFEADTTRRFCKLWGVCAVLNAEGGGEGGGIIIEFYAFQNDGDCRFAGDYYIDTLLKEYPHVHGLQLWGENPGWVIEAEDLNDICDDIIQGSPRGFPLPRIY